MWFQAKKKRKNKERNAIQINDFIWTSTMTMLERRTIASSSNVMIFMVEHFSHIIPFLVISAFFYYIIWWISASLISYKLFFDIFVFSFFRITLLSSFPSTERIFCMSFISINSDSKWFMSNFLFGSITFTFDLGLCVFTSTVS